MRAEIERGHQTTRDSLGMQNFVFGNFPAPAAFAAFAGACFIGWMIGKGSVGVGLVLLIAGLGYWDFRRYQRGSPMLHTVALTLTFTEAEKQVIKDNKLETLTIMQREPDVTQLAKLNLYASALEKMTGVEADLSSLRVRNLMDSKKDTYRLTTVLDAKNYEAELADTVLPTLSGYLKGNVIYDGEIGKRVLEF